jgi:tripartite-type tricarboxylate transporter receptor subunit TctC
MTASDAPQHELAGKVALVTGGTRHAGLPDVPTFEESGYKGFNGKFIQADIAHWSALARERKISLDD